MDLGVEANRLRVPIALLGGAEEVFVRVGPEQVAARHPCYAERMQEIETPAALD
jgi:hypothetical protein